MIPAISFPLRLGYLQVPKGIGNRTRPLNVGFYKGSVQHVSPTKLDFSLSLSFTFSFRHSLKNGTT